jgi:hypothetical protein
MRAICRAMLIAGLSLGAAAPTLWAGEPSTDAGLHAPAMSLALPLSSRFPPHNDPAALGNNGRRVALGDRSFVTPSSDRLDVSLKFPGATPYLGLGYGLESSSGSSVRFELGSSIGRPSVNELRSGTGLGSTLQTEFDKDPAQLRDGMGRTGIVPLVSLGMRLKF